jgi:hypothetical protein
VKSVPPYKGGHLKAPGGETIPLPARHAPPRIVSPPGVFLFPEPVREIECRQIMADTNPKTTVISSTVDYLKGQPFNNVLLTALIRK